MATATLGSTLARSELLALPATIDVETAGRAFGIGRTTAYSLAKSGTFPCKVLRAGKAYRVVTEDLLRVLHITPENGDSPVYQPGAYAGNDEEAGYQPASPVEQSAPTAK